MTASLEDRFAAAMAASAPFEDRPRLAAALSGGADSRALLLLAENWVRQTGGDVEALIVDHGLRHESASEAAETAAWCAARNIAARILPVQVKPGNLQQEARRARYDAMLGQCAADGRLHLLLGHHAGDRRETILMRLAAGAGPAGLAGMRSVEYRRPARLLRPLLAIEPGTLRDWLAARGEEWVDDPSNADRRFSRIRLRPLAAEMASSGWNAERLERQHSRMAESADAERRELARFLARHARFHACGFVEWDAAAFDRLSDGLASRLTMRLLRTVRGDGRPRSEEIEAMIAHIRGGAESATLHGCRLLRKNGRDFLCREPATLLEEEASRQDSRFRLRKSGSWRYAAKEWPLLRRRLAERGVRRDWPGPVWSSLVCAGNLDETGSRVHIAGMADEPVRTQTIFFDPAESAC